MVKKCSLGTIWISYATGELPLEYTAVQLTMKLEIQSTVHFISMLSVSTGMYRLGNICIYFFSHLASWLNERNPAI